jgi:hypothetical protein
MIFRKTNRLKDFVKQLFPAPPRDEMDSARSRVLQRLKEELPDRVAEFRFQPRPNELPPFERFEKTVLLAVCLVPRGDTARIHDQVEMLCGSRTYHRGSVWDVLLWLDQLGLVSSKRIDGGDDRSRIWAITSLGSRLLAKKSIWQRATEKVVDFA